MMEKANKELPPDPPVDRTLLPQRDISVGMAMSPPPEIQDMPYKPEKQSSTDSYQSAIPNSATEFLQSLPKGLPAGPKVSANALPVSRKPLPPKKVESTPDKPVEERARAVVTGPTLASLSAGPKPQAKHKPSMSLTSATIPGPVPLPDFSGHQRSTSEAATSSLRSHSRNRSLPRAAEQTITIAIEVPKCQHTHRDSPLARPLSTQRYHNFHDPLLHNRNARQSLLLHPASLRYRMSQRFVLLSWHPKFEIRTLTATPNTVH